MFGILSHFWSILTLFCRWLICQMPQRSNSSNFFPDFSSSPSLPWSQESHQQHQVTLFWCDSSCENTWTVRVVQAASPTLDLVTGGPNPLLTQIVCSLGWAGVQHAITQSLYLAPVNLHSFAKQHAAHILWHVATQQDTVDQHKLHKHELRNCGTAECVMSDH